MSQFVFKEFLPIPQAACPAGSTWLGQKTQMKQQLGKPGADKGR